MDPRKKDSFWASLFSAVLGDSKPTQEAPQTTYVSAPLPAEHISVVVLGESGVGKSSLITRICDDTFSDSIVHSADKKTRIINGETITFRDGEYNYESRTGRDEDDTRAKSNLSGAYTFIILFDITNPDSFKLTDDWLKQINHVAGNKKLSVVIVGTKSDLDAERKVSSWEAQEKAQTFDGQYLEISSKTSANIELLLRWLAKKVLELKVRAEESKSSSENRWF